jgi:cell fate regulator YaaT (PSP1 superfamily)
MCCLRYEHETYEHEIKLTPPVDSLVETPEGKGTVTEISPLAATVKVRLLSTPDAPPKTYKRDELIVLKRKEAKTNED